MTFRIRSIALAILFSALGGAGSLAQVSLAQEKTKLPRCYLDITADGAKLGRIVVELRSDVVPKTAENFRVLCTGEGPTKGTFYLLKYNVPFVSPQMASPQQLGVSNQHGWRSRQ